MKTFQKDPDEVLDYQVNWSEWLGADTITTSTWTVQTGITDGLKTNTSTTTTIWLSGGTAGVEYEIKNKIVTAGGRTAERSFYVAMVEPR